jgi:putative transposase
MKEFVDQHRDTYGVEPICKVLQIAPSGYRRHAAHQRNPALRCARAQRDDGLMPQIEQVWQVNMQVYGADKVWQQLNREGVRVARCTVERLMKRLGLEGVRRGKVVRTTISDKAAPCPLDRVNRQFKADRPNQLWVSDFTYVSTWQGWLYVAFVIDVFARRIVGWRVSRSMRSDFVLDALEQALFDRQPERSEALVHHSDRGIAVCLHPIHRAARRGWYRALCGQSWRQLRQRFGRDDQRTVQGRIDPPSCTLEEHRIG